MTASPGEFLVLIKTHSGIIHKLCRLYRHEDADRQDLFQEIIIQLWKSWPSFRGESKISTWMYRIALNTAIADFRKLKRSLPTAPLDLAAADLADPNVGDEKEEQIRHLYMAIHQLNDIDKAIVLLYLEEKSYEEMEEILGIHQGNLRVKMTRIKEKLRQLTNCT